MAKSKKKATSSKPMSFLIPKSKPKKRIHTLLSIITFLVAITLILISTAYRVSPWDPIKYVFVPKIAAVLLLLGALIGFLNVTRKETLNFLMASAVLLLITTTWMTTLIKLWGLGELIELFLMYLRVLILPAALIVAFKAIILVLTED